MKKVILSLLFFLLIPFSIVTIVYGENGDSYGNDLKGLKRINIQIDIGDPISNLIEKQIKTDVELKLRLVGIKIIGEEEINSSKDGILYIRIEHLKYGSSDSYFYILDIFLVQGAFLKRNNLYTNAVSTIGGSIGTIPINDINFIIREDINDDMDEFLNAYLSVNPK